MGISFVKNCGIIKLSVKKANCIDNTGVKGCNAMKEITKETLLKAMKSRDAGEHPVFRECEFKDMDLSGMNLHNMDFTLSSFQNVNLERVNFENCSVENALFDGNSLHGANFQNANMKTAAFRGCDMRECNFKGANLYGAVLEHAKLDDIQSDEATQWFRMHCPETGPILGYKKCVNDRVVQLLIPADAKRTSATRSSCRCSKAKVLSIKNFDETEEFEEAWSLVDENFVYRKGRWVEVKDFNEDRWMDSTTGIHFWMNRNEALGY